MDNVVLKAIQTVNGIRNVMPCINPRIHQTSDGYSISYLEQDKTHVSFKISDDKCILLRKGIYSTHLHLIMDGQSYARITSIYGNVEYDLVCISIICGQDCWQIEYQMDDQIISFKWVLMKN